MAENKPDYAIGIDIGGTNIKLIAVNMEGKLLAEESIATCDSAPKWPQRVRELCVRVEASQSADATYIGVAAPGLANSNGDCINWMPGRLPGLEGLVWKDILGHHHSVSVLNDAHAALLGEIWKGSAKNCSNVVLLTLGTGVGGAIVCDGQLLKGNICRAGALGHICLDVDGELDVCNTPGSLEDAIGECTLARRSSGQFTSTKELLTAYQAGDSKAKQVWLRSVKYLSCAIISIINAVDPSLVLIGGGVAQANVILLKPLRQYLNKLEWCPGGSSVEIRLASIGVYAGAYGAAYYAIQEALKRNVHKK